ncbi:ABC transporter ATP-binding protein [Bacillus sp. T33-2]|uniref:ABC transporter ATP-binding protein n=1 Tax=Bacillus sp. T33-2 TaxID=2054168 RepID=UPI000C77879E|nr:ABC transporter ATP-binding protein [Bacillus sp. T33-2]PLR94154.1 ABC transporter [Bacillus sp. T33-2]
MIRMKNVSKEFDGLDAVAKVDMSVHKGSIYGLVGSNGAGKTTLLKLIAGIYRQDNGDVTVNGEAVYENVGLKDSIFFIPDYPYFFPQYTIIQMANFYKSVYAGWDDGRFNRLLELFEIDMKKKLHTYSKGLQRQTAFILALSTMPEILLLDEPMDGLDPVVRKKVKNLLIQDVADREMTLLISSHNLREIEDICDHIGILHKGKLVIEKELDDLKSDVHKIQVAFKGEIPAEMLERLKPLHTEKRGSVLLCVVRGREDEISTVVDEFNPVIFDLLPLTLEEIFIYEMGDIGYAIKNVLV